MPIYEFRCQDCGHVFELVSIKKGDSIEMKCPKCDCPEIERIMSRVNIASGGGRSRQPIVSNRSCPSGTCTTIDLPGHKK